MRGSVDTTSHPVILFDGVCNLCNGWVNFVINRDPAGRFHFAPLQSDRARELLNSVTYPVDFDSIVLLDGSQIFEKSDAILRIVSKLSWGWPVLGILRVIPRGVRDRVYDVVASHRYLWFGRTDACHIPAENLQSRFL